MGFLVELDKVQHQEAHNQHAVHRHKAQVRAVAFRKQQAGGVDHANAGEGQGHHVGDGGFQPVVVDDEHEHTAHQQAHKGRAVVKGGEAASLPSATLSMDKVHHYRQGGPIITAGSTSW